MWPWGHLAVGYLCYVAVLRMRARGEQTLFTLSAVAIGTQFPDLIDKPLAWSVSVLPSGRSLTHSLLTATVLIVLGYWLGQRVDRTDEAVAFAVGYLSHSFTDLGPEVVVGLVQGDMRQLEWTTYLLWPLLASPPYEQDHSFLEHFVAFEFDAYAIAQFVLFGLAITVWLATGAPGLLELRHRLQQRLSRGRGAVMLRRLR